MRIETLAQSRETLRSGSKASEKEIKDAFKKMFTDKAEDIFKSNPNLFNKIKDFKNYISDSRFTSDNKLFDFIKAE